MFYKLIFNETDKRKKIDTETSTFQGLIDYTKRVFKMQEEVGFLFLGQDDVSAYEITCDEDLEYVLEVSKAYAYRSKFVVIKVIENFDTSPENPDKFSMVGQSETFLEDSKVKSFGESSTFTEKSLKESVVIEEPKTDLRDDLKEFDEKVIGEEKTLEKEDTEDQDLIESLESMIPFESKNSTISDMVEMTIVEETKQIEDDSINYKI